MAELDRARVRSDKAVRAVTKVLDKGRVPAAVLIAQVAQREKLDKGVVQQAVVALLQAGRVYLDPHFILRRD